MKVLILGAGGMLGHKMYQTLSKKPWEVWASFRKDFGNYKSWNLFERHKVIDQLDVLNESNLSQVLMELQPQVVINCVGVTTRKLDPSDIAGLVKINSYLPHYLSSWVLSNPKTRLVHFSTDCVFSGGQGGYTEESPRDAQDLYGLSKALGEIKNNEQALTIRSSIVGRELESKTELIEWLISQRGKKINGFTQSFYTGITTNAMSHLVGEIIEHHKDLHGVYQIASEKISKYELLKNISEKLKLNIEVQPFEGKFSDKSLVGKKFVAETGLHTPSWEQMIDELSHEMAFYEKQGERHVA